MRSANIKNLIILLVEIVVIFLMALRIIPLEAGLFLTGLLIFYFLFSPLADSLWLFIASIPLFVALPLTETFNSMSNWRILLFLLFLLSLQQILKDGILVKIKSAKQSRIFILISVFLLIGLLSLFNATSQIISIKRLLYLINIFMLYFVVRAVVKNRESFLKIIKAVGVAVGLVLAVGYTQFISIFFVPLYTFWQFWAKNVIPIFYGQALSHLLSYSNTWFSYYAEAFPTLRIFSVFPDSHSFALFLILGLPFLIALVVIPPTVILRRPKADEGSRSKQLSVYFLILLSLLAAVLSGSRGVWLSALVPLGLLILIVILRRVLRSRSAQAPRAEGSRRKQPSVVSHGILSLRSRMTFYKIHQIKIPKILTASLIIFFLCFPLSSLLLNLSQKAQGAISGEETNLIFERAKSILSLSELSAKSRIEIWQRTLDSITTHPILGVGIGNYPVVLGEELAAAKRGASAHNLYLDVLAEMGIFALLVLLLIFWEILRRAWQVFTQSQDRCLKTFAVAFILYFIWLLAYNVFDVVLLNDKVLLLFTVAVALLYSVPINLFPERSDPSKFCEAKFRRRAESKGIPG